MSARAALAIAGALALLVWHARSRVIRPPAELEEPPALFGLPVWLLPW